MGFIMFSFEWVLYPIDFEKGRKTIDRLKIWSKFIFTIFRNTWGHLIENKKITFSYQLTVTNNKPYINTTRIRTTQPAYKFEFILIGIYFSILCPCGIDPVEEELIRRISKEYNIGERELIDSKRWELILSNPCLMVSVLLSDIGPGVKFYKDSNTHLYIPVCVWPCISNYSNSRICIEW